MEHATPPATLVLTNNLEFKRDGEDTRVKDWLVRIFPNKYPALLKEHKYLDGISLYGYHEVIAETPIHNENVYLRYPFTRLLHVEKRLYYTLKP